MKRFLLYFIFVIVLIFNIYPKETYANTYRYATCDQCGLCADILDDTPPMSDASKYNIKGSVPTQSWPTCMKCLYPDITLDPATFSNFESLRMIPDPENVANYIPNPPKKGHFYTGIGCFTTNLSDFTEEGAASALTRPLLNVLLSLAGGIAFLYLLYGAFLIVTSRGDPEQLSQGRRTIMGSIIGVVFAMSAVFLINLIANGILKIPGF